MSAPTCPLTKQIIQFTASHEGHFFETEVLEKALTKDPNCPTCKKTADNLQKYDIGYFATLRTYIASHPNAPVTLQGKQITRLDSATIDELQKKCEQKKRILHITQLTIQNISSILNITAIAVSCLWRKTGTSIPGTTINKSISLLASLSGIILSPLSSDTNSLSAKEEIDSRIKTASVISVGLGTAIGLSAIKIANLTSVKWGIITSLIGGPLAIGVGKWIAASSLGVIKPLSGIYVGVTSFGIAYLGSFISHSITIIKENTLSFALKGVLGGLLSYYGTYYTTKGVAKGHFTKAIIGTLCVSLASFTGNKTVMILSSVQGLFKAITSLKPEWGTKIDNFQEKVTAHVETIVTPVLRRYHLIS